MTGSSALRTVDITSKNATWTWALVQALTGDLKTKKTSNGDTGVLWIDSMGFRVTTSPAAPAAGTYGPTSFDPLPLTDTYDSTKLQYVSATVAPTSVSAGTITWSNLGPLNAGTRKSIDVTFLALTPPDINANGEPDSTTTVNTASSTNAYFVSGRPTNPATATSTVTINPRGSIGDLVWWDINADGIKQVSEPGLANILVGLDNGAQTYTDTNGYYLFSNLVDGTYTISVATTMLPWSSYTQTKDPDATVNSASTVTINNNDGLSNNNSYLDRDFGYDSALNVITGTIFRDTNGDGLRGSAESVLSGISVTLLRDADLNGSYETTVTIATTDSAGYYVFGSLANGNYRVVVTQPASTTQTLDPDLAPGVTTGDNAVNKSVSGGNLYPNNNFAYQTAGALTLGDTLYIDWNGNGTQDTGEEGIANVDVLLYRDTNGDGVIDPTADPLRASTATNASGVYGFSGLPANAYIVVVNTADPQFPANVIQIQDYDGTRDSKGVVNLTVSLATVDFGYKPQGSASIGDTVFVDADGDGVKDAIESGIANVGVSLYEDSNNNGVIDAATDALLATATTSASGTYLFTGLAAGNYLVDVNEAAASIPSDAYANKYRLTTTDPHDVTLAAGQAYLTADFGFAAPATIGDFVFFDANGNATQDFSETGIPNVTVQLFADANQDGQPDSPTPLASTTTATGSGANPAGFYQFTNLAAGTYFVKVLTTSLPQSGGQPIPLTADPDRDGVPVGDNTYPSLPAGDHGDSLVIVSLGGNYLGADFGYRPPGAIGDFVWLDLDQDSVQDAGEPGIANVSVRISNGTTTYTVATDFDGRWSFSNLADGAWTVSIPASNFVSGAPLENTAATYDADGGSNSSTALVLSNGTVNLAAGNLGIDFGYKLNGSYSLAGTVVTHDTRVAGTADDSDDFFDDGIDHDAGPLDETELAGIVVYLYTTGGHFLGSTVTDVAGNYSFSGLPSGGYRVIIAPPADSTLTTTAANNPAVSSVTSGTSVIQTLAIATASVINVDFAFISNANYDFGDLPSLYAATTLAQDGARHIIPAGGSTVYFGTAPDADINGIASAWANGDDSMGTDDENGIAPLAITSWVNGTGGGSIQATVTGNGWLVGWIDWNHDGDLLDPGELVANRAVSTGNTTITFDIPAGTIGAISESWLSRFRIFTTKPPYPLFSYTGVATDGEVEDFLLEKPVGASIGDLVWNDANGNGLIDASENGIGGITVVLRDNNNTIVGTQVTGSGSTDVDGDGVFDPPGYYRFRGLGAGNFTVTVSTPPAGFNASYDENGIATLNISAVSLGANVQHLSADFGYAPMLANISGQVRYDIDADGDFNDPDNGGAVVKIQLWTDPNGDGNPADGQQVAETYTGIDGRYSFTAIPSGKYTVVEINPVGTTSTADVNGANDDRIAVTLLGINITGRDFLDTQPPLFAISGTVYDDDNATNDNLIGGGDAHLPNIPVLLFFDRDANGVVSAGDSQLAAIVTNAAGFYNFAGLPAGAYVVQETDPSGAVSEWDAQGSLTDNQIGVVVTNANVINRNFLDDGYLGSIGNRIWDDEDHDGHFNGSEVGIAGIAVQLYLASQTPGVDTPQAVTVTDGSGIYQFDLVVPGSYRIYVPSPPAGIPGVSEINNSGDNQIDNDNNGIQSVIGGPVSSPVIAIAAGENDATIDFGFSCQGTWAEWQILHPLGGNNGAAGNPDNDALDNLIEFSFCQDPASGVGNPYAIQPSTSSPGTLEAVFTRPEGALENVTYRLHYAAALGIPTTWSTLDITPAIITVVDNGDCTESVVIHDLETLTGLSGGKGFVRISTDLDGTHTSYTEVEGWTKTAVGICCRTYNDPYLRASLFTGIVDSVSGQSINLAGSMGSFDFTSLLEPGVSYFIEVTSGDNEGQRFDIASGAGATLTLVNDGDLFAGTAPFNTLTGAPPANLAGDSIIVRRHWTVAKRFPIADWTAALSHTDADQVQTFHSGVWTTYWLYSNGGSPEWVKTGDGTMADQGAIVLPPGQGCYVLRRTSPMNRLAYGEVRGNAFVHPLGGGSRLVAGGYPIDQSPTGSVSRQLNFADGFFGSRDTKTADSFFVWKGDVVPGSTGYDSYFLMHRDSPTQTKWVKIGDASLLPRDSALLFVGDASVLLRIASNHATYTIPSPWTP